MPISAVIERHSAERLEIPAVVGVAEGARDGHPVVVVVESGEIRSQ